MEMKDILALANWKNATLNDVENVNPIGLVGNVRFTYRAKRRFKLMHEWGTERFSSTAQDRFYSMHGRDAYLRRIARVQKMIDATWGKS